MYWIGRGSSQSCTLFLFWSGVCRVWRKSQPCNGENRLHFDETILIMSSLY